MWKKLIWHVEEGGVKQDAHLSSLNALSPLVFRASSALSPSALVSAAYQLAGHLAHTLTIA
jgi:hypothetical protein